ncbi:MAG: SspB family protein [Paracoccaceae bacterium]
MSDTIDYGNLMHRAMRGLIQNVLEDIAQNGLPGDHHFFITFDTRHPDVKIADWLTDRFPEEMTIVIQHEYEDLTITDEGFSLVLSFGDTPELLVIPYDSLRSFVDPSVEFGLRFEPQKSDSSADKPGVAKLKIAEDSDKKSDKKLASSDAEVVSLDSFRK